MRSWILRHRLRLRLIYGPSSASGPESTAGRGDAAVDPAGTAARTYGRLRRSADGLELVPMPRRAGRPRRVG